MTSDQAGILLRDYLSNLRDSWAFGWETHLAHLHPSFSTSCRAQMIQNLAVDKAHQLLSGQVQRLEDQNAQLLVIPGIALVRFKKLSSQLLPTNNHTARSRGFYSQFDLPGLPDLPRLICGLKVTDGWTGWDGVFIVHPRAVNAVNWALDITHGVQEIDNTQVRLDLEDDNEPFFTSRTAEQQDELESQQNA
jgi:hypothetical protein